MYCISVSHKTTPADLRQLLAFSEKEKREFSAKLLSDHNVNGCIIVSTCNRSELYFTSDKECMEEIKDALLEFKRANREILKRHFKTYYDKDSVWHLFKVACGLESMVLGEDEILRQIKEAYQLASEYNFTDGEINIIFQGAFHCSKKIKTVTKISTTAVSIGTLTANFVAGFMKEISKENCKVLLVGASGKIGSIVAKNLLDKGIEIIGTSRKQKTTENKKNDSRVKLVEYEERYQFVKEIAVIISATTSPHYTFTYENLCTIIDKEKRYMMIDLSIPYDIDKKIGSIQNIELYDIDYFKGLAAENNEIKYGEIKEAEILIDEGIEDTLKKLYLREFKLSDYEIQEGCVDKSIYSLKDSLDSIHFKMVLDTIKDRKEGETLNGIFSFSD